MPDFTIPLMLTVNANDYDSAFGIAVAIADSVQENCAAVHADDTDNYGQRVYYLESIDEIVGFGQDDDFPSVAAGEPVYKSDILMDSRES